MSECDRKRLGSAQERRRREVVQSVSQSVSRSVSLEEDCLTTD